MEKIDEKKKGDHSLLYAEEANKLIVPLNSLIKITVEPSEFGTFTIEKDSSKLDLSPMQDLIGGLTPQDPDDPENINGTTVIAMYVVDDFSITQKKFVIKSS